VSKASETGTPITTILLAIFITLKLTNNVDWSWFWVLSPFWIPCALLLVIVATLIVVAVVVPPFTAASEWLGKRDDEHAPK